MDLGTDVPRAQAAPSADAWAPARWPTTSTASKRLEDAGAAAIVLRSLFEEQITREQMSEYVNLESHDESFAEAASYVPEPEPSRSGPVEYLEHLRRVKEAVGHSGHRLAQRRRRPGGWIEYARLMEQAGADALELNLYRIGDRSGDERSGDRAPGCWRSCAR